jgi:hypothetical protein
MRYKLTKYNNQVVCLLHTMIMCSIGIGRIQNFKPPFATLLLIVYSNFYQKKIILGSLKYMLENNLRLSWIRPPHGLLWFRTRVRFQTEVYKYTQSP